MKLRNRKNGRPSASATMVSPADAISLARTNARMASVQSQGSVTL